MTSVLLSRIKDAHPHAMPSGAMSPDRDEVRKILACQWSDNQIDTEIAIYAAVAARLRDGDAIDISESMGSCQCGDISAHVSLVGGVPITHSTGREEWQRYHGPARDCRVGYQVGRRSREIAQMFAWLSK